jgi:four helix bundle protein
MQDFKNLRVWHAAHRLSLAVFVSCEPKVYARSPGLRSQTARTAKSIAATIAEGAPKSDPEFARYLDIALGATTELENHLLFARDADIMPPAIFEGLNERVDHVRRMIIALLRAIRGE